MHPISGHILNTSGGQSLPLQALLSAAIGRTPQGFLLTDETGIILYANPAMTGYTGYSQEELLGNTPHLFRSGKHDSSFYEKLWKALRESGHWQGEIWNRRKEGDIFVAWLSISAVVAEPSTYYCGILMDITERKKLEHKLKLENRMLEKLSLVDALTGVANRRAFDRCLEKEWERGARSGQPLSLLLVDIDHFKLYNDQFGHQKGDEALRRVASLLESGLHRAGDFLGRYGGEEFGVILPETDLEGAVRVAQTLRDTVVEAAIPHPVSGVDCYITISVGCSTLLPSAGGSWEELLQTADKALYGAKERGRNRIQIRG